jgi:CheY-like chemotaxis protein
VKQLVELHGGSVRVHSDGPGRGSTFIIALPFTILLGYAEPRNERRHPRVAAKRSDTADVNVNIKDVRVLVVDDETDARALVKRLLEGAHAVVTAAESADDAIKLLQRGKKFDVVICDIGMPGEDGYSLIKRIRSLGTTRGAAIPAIALTAYARVDDRVKAIAAGFQMHIAKPVEPVELITMVASAAGRTGR